MAKNKRRTESQHDAFIAAARAAECDEDPAAFDAKMRAMVKVKPAPKRPPSKPKR